MAAAREARFALNLQIQEISELRSLVESTDQLLKALASKWSALHIGAHAEKNCLYSGKTT